MEAEAMRNELISTAGLRLERYQTLISLAEEQRSMLVEGRHSDLLENLGEHDFVLTELSQLDKREGMLASRLRDLDADGPPPPGYELEYRQITGQTKDAATHLRSLVQANTELLANTMEYIGFSLSILAKLASEQESYDPKSDGVVNPAIMLDSKV